MSIYYTDLYLCLDISRSLCISYVRGLTRRPTSITAEGSHTRRWRVSSYRRLYIFIIYRYIQLCLDISRSLCISYVRGLTRRPIRTTAEGNYTQVNLCLSIYGYIYLCPDISRSLCISYARGLTPRPTSTTAEGSHTRRRIGGSSRRRISIYLSNDILSMYVCITVYRIYSLYILWQRLRLNP